MFKKLLKNLVCAAGLMAAGFSTANAALLIQNLEIDQGQGAGWELAGQLVLDLDKADFGTFIDDWEYFNLYSFDALTLDDALAADPFDPFLYFGSFVAQLNQDNMWRGLEYISFDVSNDDGFFFFDGEIDIAFPQFSYLSVFDQNANGPYVAGAARFGDYAYVPEPSMFLLFLTGLAGVALRRKA